MGGISGVSPVNSIPPPPVAMNFPDSPYYGFMYSCWPQGDSSSHAWSKGNYLDRQTLERLCTCVTALLSNTIKKLSYYLWRRKQSKRACSSPRGNPFPSVPYDVQWEFHHRRLPEPCLSNSKMSGPVLTRLTNVWRWGSLTQDPVCHHEAV